MRINALRKELSALLAAAPVSRPAALRRSLREDWLYATDAPGLLTGDGWEQLTGRLKEAGWEYERERDWLLLRKTAKEPPEGWYGGSFGPEASCCRSLLERHPEKAERTADRARLALIRAGEEGEKAYEAACLKLHREWADRLRRGEPLPDVSLTYFGG